MKKDEAMFTEQHGVNIDKTGLYEFKQYTRSNLSKFRFSKQISGKHHVFKWTNTSDAKLVIYEVMSIIPCDIVYFDKIVHLDSVTKKTTITPGEKVTLKPANFIFHTFIIQPDRGKQLI